MFEMCPGERENDDETETDRAIDLKAVKVVVPSTVGEAVADEKAAATGIDVAALVSDLRSHRAVCAVQSIAFRAVAVIWIASVFCGGEYSLGANESRLSPTTVTLKNWYTQQAVAAFRCAS